MDTNNNTGALITGIKENLKTEIITLPGPDGEGNISVIAHSKGSSGISLASTKALVDEWRTVPERIKGMAQHTHVESFIDHLTEFKDVNSVVYADRSNLKLLAYYDYHAATEPNNLSHKSRFAPRKSRQLEIWEKGHGIQLMQGDFANFIENNILDLADGSGHSTITDIAKQLNTTVASPSRILELARGLSIHESANAKSHVNTATGEVTLEYITTHSDTEGKKLKLPGLFVIGIPVFEGGALYRIMVRLRYRLQEGKVRWWYELYQLDAAIDDAFEEIIEKVVDTTKIKLYRGHAEDSSS